MDIKIDNDIKGKMAEREETFRYLTSSTGSPGQGITPIIMEFADGTKEQRGMRLSLNGAPPAAGDLNIIFCTHHNETAILDGIKQVLEAFRKNPEAFKGRGINLLLGGQKERCHDFFRRIRENAQGYISAEELESFRNTASNVNCNRVPKARIEPPDSTPGSLGWLQQIHDFYDRSFYGKGDGSSKELMTITFDGHTTSNPGEPMAIFYGMTLEQAKQFKELAALTGATGVFAEPTSDLPTRYMCETATPAAGKLALLAETGQHMALDAGSTAERAVVGLLYSLGIEILSPFLLPRTQPLTFYRDPALLYTPGSPNAGLNPPGVVPVMEKPGQYGDVQLINSMSDVPESVRRHFEREGVVIRPAKDGLKNGGEIHRGDHIAWTYFYAADGEVIPVLLSAPKDGVTFMAPQKSLIPAAFPDSIVEIEERDQTITVPIPESPPLPLQVSTPASSNKNWINFLNERSATQHTGRA
ncbi:hypothetical protein [Thermogemmatispora carboxidivorans]|uniref:hypothetical protein n=1 Tax=Thermogemmatispora carboxidivorans TaxID=1382306 RepID=UPI00069BEA2A|nr:hypothetical protein [Thermogemmatispora carboxidivorans]